MAREGLEVADVFRHFGPAFRDQNGASLSNVRRRGGTGSRYRGFFPNDLALLEMVGAAHSLNPALAASQPRTGDASAAIQRP